MTTAMGKDQRQELIDEAKQARRAGASHDEVVAFFVENGLTDADAAEHAETVDLLLGSIDGFIADDVPEERREKIAKVKGVLDEQTQMMQGMLNTQRKPQRPIQGIVDEAVQMAVRGRPKAKIVEFLQAENIADAEPTASKIMLRVEADKAAVSKEVNKARNSAYLKIAGGVAIGILGLFLMASGAESSGRRSPLGAVLAAGFLIASGISTLNKISDAGY